MKKTKVILTLVCAVLLVAASVMGTLAYLTDTTDTVTNTFSVGKVGFDADGGLDEAKVNQYGQKVDTDGEVYTEAEGQTLADRVTSNSYKLVPGTQYVKDPTVHVSPDSEDAWLFVKVVNGIADIEAEGTTTIAAQMTAKGWTPVTEGSNVYYYNSVVSANTDVVVFESFKLATDADVENYEEASITIQAALVQAQGFENALSAWNENSTLFG